jgi:hypothetical protein
MIIRIACEFVSLSIPNNNNSNSNSNSNDNGNGNDNGLHQKDKYLKQILLFLNGLRLTFRLFPTTTFRNLFFFAINTSGTSG